MLHNKTALVTGSTSGIGLAVACELAKAGANIMLNGFGEVDAARQEMAGYGVKHAYHGADLTKPEQIEDMMQAARKEFGRVDILVNNAGIQHVAPVDEFPPDRWETIIALNLSAAFHTTRLLLPEMKAAGWGRIINMASAHGLVASTGKAAYVAAKHGIVGLSKVTALETARTGVTCNAICPGWVLTPLVQKQIEARSAAEGITLQEAQQNLLMEKQPSGQFVLPEDLGQLVVFLCSRAAQEIRGAALAMDGAWTAQ